MSKCGPKIVYLDRLLTQEVAFQFIVLKIAGTI